MKIYGVDFTSAPRSRKPITWAQCKLEGESLRLEAAGNLTSFEAFEGFLAQPGPWIAGLDFPFGQPRRLVENIGWPRSWDGYVRRVGEMSKQEFVEALDHYRESRPSGDKQHLRRTDVLANSRSPMMLFGVPVGKMFFEGAPRLLRSGASILPCRPNGDSRVIIEAYPALVVRRWIGNRSYKNDEVRKQTEALRAARAEIVAGLGSGAKAPFGFDVQFEGEWARACIGDGTGDQLDALLCAVQAGWAHSQREDNFGIPRDCDPLEGWIVDPLLGSM